MFEQLIANCGVTTVAYLVAFAFYYLFSKPAKNIQVCDIALMVFLVVVTGARYDVGADWKQYYNTFSNILASSSYFDTIYSWYGLDSGFWYLMAVISRFPPFNEPHVVFWVTSLLTYPAMVVYFRKKTEAAPWAFVAYLFLGFFGSSINVLRHTLAAVCFLWAFEARLSRKWLAFITLSALAVVFHSSSVVAIAIAILAGGRRPSGKLLLICLALGAAGLVLYMAVFNLLAGVFPFLSRYVTTLDKMSGDLDRSYMWIVSFIYLALTCATLMLYLRETSSDENMDTRMDSIMVACEFALIPNVVSFAVWPVDRMAFFVLLTLIAVVPYLVKRNPKLQVPLILALVLWHVPYSLFAWDNINPFGTYLFGGPV